MHLHRKIFSLLILSLTYIFSAEACPSINSIPDFNCDGELNIVFLGDSLVYGYGDTANNNKGGYVTRVQQKLTKVHVHNWGKQGMKARDLVTTLRNVFDRNSNAEMKVDLESADLVVLDIGRNDRWFFGTPEQTFRNLKRCTQKIITEVTDTYGEGPLVVKAVMMLPNRGSQGPWMSSLNNIILSSNSTKYPADLRFDRVSKRLLSSDQIHPTSQGYAALASTFLKYVTKKIPSKMKKLHPDTDQDDIDDIYETLTYHTDPNLADTDGDGKTDGDEVFRKNTNPLVAD